jgi:glycosyltransferase involved in cell wall biosynthesis
LNAIVHELRGREIGLLCTHGYKADILGLLAGRLSGVPVACFLRGWTGENVRVRLYETADRLVLPLAKSVVCLSESQASHLKRVPLIASRVRTVTNAIDIPKLTAQALLKARRSVRELLGFPANCPLIASAGRLSPEKGVAVFLDAAAELLRQLPNCFFAVFGDGALRAELELKCKALGLRNRLRFAGFLPDLREYLPGVDILVNPSFSEEMPNIVLEAMAAGIPVVATAVGGVPEIAGSDPAIFLIRAGDAKVIVEGVASLVRDPETAKRFGERGRSRVQAAYSAERQRGQLHAVYCEHLTKRNLSHQRIVSY